MVSLRESATHILVGGDGGELDIIADWFKYRPDGYWFAPSYQRYIVTHGKEGWDGYLRSFQRFSTTMGRIRRGHKPDLMALLKDQNFRVDEAGLLPSPFSLSPDDVPDNVVESDFDLDAHQKEGIAYWLNEAVGICRVTVSGGKTVMFAGAAALIRTEFPKARVLYVTQAERLVRQVTKEMKKFLPEWEVGQYGGGHYEKDAKDMVICTIAMLNKHFIKLKASGWFHKFMVVCYDEVHHCGSKTSKRVLDEVTAYFRLGASDSLKSEDIKKNTEIHGLFGRMLIDVTAAPLIKRGRIALPTIHVIDIPAWNNRFQHLGASPAPQSRAFVMLDGQWHRATYKGPVYETDEAGAIKTRTVIGTTKDPETGDWVRTKKPIIKQGVHHVEVEGTDMEADSQWCLLERMYDKAIVQFKERNEFIVEWAKHYSDKGYPTLIVCTRTVHILILESLLKDVVDPKLVDILFGDDSPNKRDRVFGWFANTPGSILISPLVKEGVSINEIRAGVVADYVSDWEVANQIIGRFIRKKPGDENCADIVWFVDRQHPVLRRGSDAMLERLKRLRRANGYNWDYQEHPLSPPSPKPARRGPRQLELPNTGG